MMNPIRAEQVLVNLIGNAIDAVKDAAAKSIAVRLRNEGAVVALSVADSGAGVPEPLRQRIREPFFSSKKAGEGLGLGLFICETIIHDAGGTLSLSDGEGGGAVFTVMLPLSAIEARLAAE
jgi:C4-dicarboxylate-specific signal transduction histidine kinase